MNIIFSSHHLYKNIDKSKSLSLYLNRDGNNATVFQNSVQGFLSTVSLTSLIITPLSQTKHVSIHFFML